MIVLPTFGRIAGAVETEIGVLHHRMRTLDKQTGGRGLYRNVHLIASWNTVGADRHGRRSRLWFPTGSGS